MLRVGDHCLRMFLLVGIWQISLGSEKHWLPDLEWQTRSNWMGGHLPDAHSRVIFPMDTWHTVGLPNTGNLEVAEILLPREGTLCLGLNGVLALNEPKETPRDVRWSKKGIYMWIDWHNWDGYTSATPHAERIPCDNDVVVLPSKNHVVSLALPMLETHVRGVKIADEETTLNRWEWTQLAERPREFFESRLTVTYASSMLQFCNDCTCHSGMDEALAEEVCHYIWQREKCAPTACEYPLKVEGHCCDYCGGRVALSDKASLRKVEARVNEALENYRGVITWHVRKTWNGETEVLIAETGAYSGLSSQEAVDVLSDTFRDNNYLVLEKSASGAALEDSSLSTILGPMLGTPVILVLIMLAVFPYFGYSYSHLMSGWREACSSLRVVGGASEMAPKPGGFFGFARFENVPEGDVTIDEEATPATEDGNLIESRENDLDRPTTSASNKTFENPLYRSKRSDKKITTKDKENFIVQEKMIDFDAPVSLHVLESRINEDGIERVALD